VPAVFYIDTLAGVGFTPTEYVDISADIDTKLAALSCHASQLDWLRDHDGVDIIEQTRVCSRYRGYQSGVSHAEGFTACLTWLRARTTRLLP
jgi:N-acetylglucosamine malate deacetylase 1